VVSDGEVDGREEAGSRDFVSLVEWIIDRSGGTRRIVQERIVSDETLRRWRHGKVPGQRSTGAIRALDVWARHEFDDYPPRWAPAGGLVTLSGPRAAAVPDGASIGGPLDGLPAASPAMVSVHDVAGEASPVTALPGEVVPAKVRRTALVVGVAASALAAAAVLGGVAVRTFLGDVAAIGAPAGALTVEYAGNRKGSPVFADASGAPVPMGVPPRIPYGTEVRVKCRVENQSGMSSVSAFYLVEGGTWHGLHVVADTMTNGGLLGDASSPNVDPRVPLC
jgi:hypothetical protein